MVQVEPLPATGGRRLRRLFRRYGFRIRRDENGVVAVELALIALPFLALLFAIIESALILWSTQVLETAVADAARQVYTGQFQQNNPANMNSTTVLAERFRRLVCSRFAWYPEDTCLSRMKVDVRRASSFPGGVDPVIQQDSNGNNIVDPGFGRYEEAGPGEVVIVRAAVEHPVFVSILDANKSNLSPTTRLLIATAAFRTEPYQ